jgi:hypothetical protein
MKKDFIVHTAVEEPVDVPVMRLGKQIMARVIGLTVELIDKDTGKAHTHTFDDEVPAAKELFVPGQELTLSYARKEGSKTLKTADPKAADDFRNDAVREYRGGSHHEPVYAGRHRAEEHRLGNRHGCGGGRRYGAGHGGGPDNGRRTDGRHREPNDDHERQ